MFNKYLNKTILWIAFKMLLSKRSLFGGSAPLALLGLVLGVAALVVSMAVFAGFESTLKKAMIDSTGHVQVVKRSRHQDEWTELVSRIQQAEPEMVAASRFIFLEAVTAHQGKISGIMIQGIDLQESPKVLNFSQRVIAGSAELRSGAEVPEALIGKGLAKKLGLQVGDIFRAVVPVVDAYESSQFQRKLGSFKVVGILELGKFDWNERFVVTDLLAAQQMADIGDRYTGLVLKFQDSERARKSAFRLTQLLGGPYWVRDWRESNESLFEAVEVERPVIFFVVFVIVIVAAFNVTSTLYLNVMQRYADIAILKTIGLSERQVRTVFSIHALTMGAVGVILGILLGWCLSLGFSWVESNYGLMSGSVYKIEGVTAQLRWIDLIVISLSTMSICFFATLIPAKKGARLSPVEGLRYG